MLGPVNLDPSRLDAARQAYAADMAANQSQLTDNDGRSRAGNPFQAGSDGQPFFNTWVDASNRREAQDTHQTVETFNSKGKSTKQRVAAWQVAPKFYQDQATTQSDGILGKLDQLQKEGFGNMQALFKESMSKIK